MELNRAIEGRHSVRKFSNRKPNWRAIIECINSARFAPMAGNNYTLKFIMVDDEEKIGKIAEACQQDFINQARFAVVAVSNPSRTVNEYGNSGEAWTRQQAGAAMQNFLLKVEESGLSTCWVGYFIEEHIKKILKIPETLHVEAVFPIGYEFQRPKARKRKIDLDRILYFNSYGNSKMHRPKGASGD